MNTANLTRGSRGAARHLRQRYVRRGRRVGLGATALGAKEKQGGPGLLAIGGEREGKWAGAGRWAGRRDEPAAKGGPRAEQG
jgi:hypothetical protein